MNFEVLVGSIRHAHTSLQQSAVSAVNRSLTIRNWLIGFYIFHFEQKGEDRAKYGDGLIAKLAARIEIKGLGFRNLKLFRQFYLQYPQIGQTASAQLGKLADSSLLFDFQNIIIGQTTSAQFRQGIIDPEKLIARLSFSHFVEMLDIDDPLKLSFYEIECIKGNWNVRELRRQIDSLYFERSGMSLRPEKLSAMVMDKAERMEPEDIIKSVYAFEFLGLRPKEVIEESGLETALLDNLQDFLLEMGHGFCLEARQKKILIGDEHYFIDIVFYHRVLKCHILVELKMEKFGHANAGQLNTYLNYYRREVMLPGDNLPVGILLVTNKNETLVEYATAGMDNKLFVSKYLVALPAKERLERFVGDERKKLAL